MGINDDKMIICASTLSKDEILEAYLNTIYLGYGNYGIEAAARSYFDKDVRELDLAEIVLCDPSEKMLSEAKELLGSGVCGFRSVGSEELDYENRFDVVTAIQSHHYFDRATREKAVANCFRALKKGGIFICFENTAPFTEEGRDILIERLEAYELKAGRTPEEVKHHTARYGTEFFPMNILEHLDLLKKTGFAAAELLWSSYMQSGFYAIKK
jgi:tRNA (cmo5U34)-methyltransferase